jgi:hypothetical protein
VNQDKTICITNIYRIMACPSLNRKFHPDTGYSRHPANPKTQTTRPPQPSAFAHNLNLDSYTFDEILKMFDLSYSMNFDDLKRAKRKVLMIHPDKSGLPSDYFLFYKRAFEHIVNYYQANSRQTQIVNEDTSVEYVPLNDPDPQTAGQFSKTVNKMKPTQFNQRFNELFEQNMSEKPDPSKNEWFHSETVAPLYDTGTRVSTSNLNSTFETIKTRQREQGVVRYTGVRELSSFSGNMGGSSFYDTGMPIGTTNDAEEDAEDIYVSSDPFSKLKYEDLRKVHKDQTVFAVSETDFANVPKYANVEQYSRQRSSAPLVPMEKPEAERILQERERIAREQQARKQHYTELKMQEYAEKNKKVMGAFLQLENGRRNTL